MSDESLIIDVRRFIGIPYRHKACGWDGVDCWGLVRLFYREQFSIELPDYNGRIGSFNDSDVTAAAVNHALKVHSWSRALRFDELGVVLVLRILGQPAHVGVSLGSGQFLHCMRGCNSVVENIDRSPWDARIMGHYRWNG